MPTPTEGKPPISTEGMPPALSGESRLGVATPGVDTATVRRCVSPTDSVTVVRATRCGRLPVRLASVSAVTIYLRECAVSVHAAERVLASLPRSIGRRLFVVDAPRIPQWLRQRFDCPLWHRSPPEQRCHR